MYHCLCISEVLDLVLEFVRCWDGGQSQRRPRVGKKTLASLAGTCRMLSSPALDVLWRDLYSFRPILNIFPIDAVSLIDDKKWLTFRSYAKRVKAIYNREASGVPAQIIQELVSSLQHCPHAYLPLLPNVTELEWSDHLFSSVEDSDLVLLRYFLGPAVTTFTFTFRFWITCASTELAAFADLPSLCPNVTSFTIVVGCLWNHKGFQELCRMVTQWPRLRTLRTCAIPQSVMDQLFTQQTLDTLSIDYSASLPVYNGRIPEMVRDFTLSVQCPSVCTRYLRTVYASPTKFCLLIGMNAAREDADVEDMFCLLPLRLDASRLRSLMIQPCSTVVGIPWWHTLKFREPLVSPLVEFTALCELDLDLLCTAQISDASYTRLARSLPHLQRLKLGTANPSIVRPWPVASVVAVIALLTYCNELETLHIVFDGTVPPPEPCESRESASLSWGWGVSNRCLYTLHVGYSPIRDANVNAIASCFASIMPCVVHIERGDRHDEWRVVERMLGSCAGRVCP